MFHIGFLNYDFIVKIPPVEVHLVVDHGLFCFWDVTLFSFCPLEFVVAKGRTVNLSVILDSGFKFFAALFANSCHVLDFGFAKVRTAFYKCKLL